MQPENTDAISGSPTDALCDPTAFLLMCAADPTCVLHRAQVQLLCDVRQRDAGVGEGDAAQARPDDVVVQAGDQVVQGRCAEDRVVAPGHLRAAELRK